MNTALATLDKMYRQPGPGLIDRLNEGLPADVFFSLADLLQLPVAQLAAAVGLSDRTLRGRAANKSRLTADEAERSFRVYRVLRRATEVLGNEERARAWLITPQRAFGERRPVELLVRDVGTEEVMNVLGAIEDGGYL